MAERLGFYRKGWRRDLGSWAGGALGLALAFAIYTGLPPQDVEIAHLLPLLAVAGMLCGNYVQNRVLEWRGVEKRPLDEVARLQIAEDVARPPILLVLQSAIVTTILMATVVLFFGETETWLIAIGPFAGIAIGLARVRNVRTTARRLSVVLPEEGKTAAASSFAMGLTIRYACMIAGVTAGVASAEYLEPIWSARAVVIGGLVGLIAPLVFGMPLNPRAGRGTAPPGFGAALRNGVLLWGIPMGIFLCGEFFPLKETPIGMPLYALMLLVIAATSVAGGAVFGALQWLTARAQIASLPRAGRDDKS